MRPTLKQRPQEQINLIWDSMHDDYKGICSGADPKWYEKGTKTVMYLSNDNQTVLNAVNNLPDNIYNKFLLNAMGYKTLSKTLDNLQKKLNERKEDEGRGGNKDIYEKAQEVVNAMQERAQKNNDFRIKLLFWLVNGGTVFLRDEILTDELKFDMKHCNNNLLNWNAFMTLDTIGMYAREIK